MESQNRFILKENLELTTNFIILIEKDILTIDKIYTMEQTNYFECVIMKSYDEYKQIFYIDQVAYDINRNKLNLFNTRNNHVTMSIDVEDDETISFYSFGTDDILIIIDKKEN